MQNRDVILEMSEINKSFPAVKALDNVSFSLAKGEVHALCGENGAGKSTLIKILTGVYTCDSGNIYFDGQSAHFTNTYAAQKAGIGTVYQELNMIPYLSVGENIYLGYYPRKDGGIDWKQMYAGAQELLDSLGIPIDATVPISQLGAAMQQMVSIVRAVRQNCKLLILDEATSSLDSHEADILFRIIQSLKERSVSFIFITHRLEEIYQICDRITVLKDGKYIGTYPVSKLSQYELITKMVGREVTRERKRKYHTKTTNEDYVVEMKNVSAPPRVMDISLGVRRGEILGLAGLLGSGRTETAEIMFGTRKSSKGKILIEGKVMSKQNPVNAVKHGLAFCTENRHFDGIVPHMSIKNNVVLSCMDKLTRFSFICSKKREDLVQHYIDLLRIKTPSQEQIIRNLSGGNQQKVLLARWLATNPKVIILDEPTRGIDVGAKQEIERLIQEIANKGISILFISSELPELVRNCDRVIVLREGRSIGELVGHEIDEDTVMHMIAAYGTENEGGMV